MVTLNTPSGDFTFTVSGFCEDDSEFNQLIDGCSVYMNRIAFEKIRQSNAEDLSPEYYIRFKENVNLKMRFQI